MSTPLQPLFTLNPTHPPKQKSLYNRNKWSQKQLLKYLIFLNNPSLYSHDKNNDLWAFYRFLSMFVQSRSPNQCRIFHKRMLNKYKKVGRIVQNLFQRIRPDFQVVGLLENSLKLLSNCLNRQRRQYRSQMEKQDEPQNCYSVNGGYKSDIKYSSSEEKIKRNDGFGKKSKGRNKIIAIVLPEGIDSKDKIDKKQIRNNQI